VSDVFPPILWRVHLRSPPDAVFRTLATPAGRARFWATSAEERDGVVHFVFPNGQQLDSRILESTPASRFQLTYFGGSRVTFELQPAADGGTELTLTEADVPPDDYHENLAGWITVLLTLKGAVDHGIDLRNHSATRTWQAGYVDV
jgi:uncharacterized protein YndB with AHSA1/START domain